MGFEQMKISKIDLANNAKKISDDLLCYVGLKNAKKIVSMIKKNLVVEYYRRKKL